MNPAQQAIDWHFSRKDLAERALASFDPGPSYALAIYERRRMGKTEFLLQDLMPLAESKGWKVFYNSFLTSDPEADFVKNLLEFVNQVTPFALKKLAETQKMKVEKIRVSLGFKETGLAVDLAKGEESAASIRTLFDALAKLNLRTIFIFDEIQVLAEGGKSAVTAKSGFVGALRTCLDMNKIWARAIFNGSSQNGLRRMFQDKGLAFYRYAHNFDFPKMGDEFPCFLNHRMIKAGMPGVDESGFAAIFKLRMDSCPALAVEVCRKLMEFPSLSLDDGCKSVLIGQNGEYARVWDDLSALQKAVLRHIATSGELREDRELLGKEEGDEDIPGLFSTGVAQELTKGMGVPVKIASVQSVVNAFLKSRGSAGEIIRQETRGVYAFQDEGFRDYVLSR